MKEASSTCNEDNYYSAGLLEIAEKIFVIKMNVGKAYYPNQVVIERESRQDSIIKDYKEIVRKCINKYFIPQKDSCQKFSDKNSQDIANICSLLFDNTEIVEQNQTEIYNTAINIYFTVNPHIDIDINFESVISISVLLYFLIRRCLPTSLNKREGHSKHYYS